MFLAASLHRWLSRAEDCAKLYHPVDIHGFFARNKQ